MTEQESTEPTVTFTWTTPEGETYRVEPCSSVDEWRGSELRAAARITGGSDIGRGLLGGFVVYAISAARVVPGLTVEQAEAQLTVGKVRAIMAELDAQYAAQADDADVAEEVEHLTPTSAGSGA